jgi:hypothetical protein
MDMDEKALHLSKRSVTLLHSALQLLHELIVDLHSDNGENKFKAILVRPFYLSVGTPWELASWKPGTKVNANVFKITYGLADLDVVWRWFEYVNLYLSTRAQWPQKVDKFHLSIT